MKKMMLVKGTSGQIMGYSKSSDVNGLRRAAYESRHCKLRRNGIGGLNGNNMRRVACERLKDGKSRTVDVWLNGNDETRGDLSCR